MNKEDLNMKNSENYTPSKKIKTGKEERKTGPDIEIPQIQAAISDLRTIFTIF